MGSALPVERLCRRTKPEIPIRSQGVAARARYSATESGDACATKNELPDAYSPWATAGASPLPWRLSVPARQALLDRARARGLPGGRHNAAAFPVGVHPA